MLKGIGVGGVSAASFYLSGCKLAENITAAGIPSTWDKEVDVVVVVPGRRLRRPYTLTTRGIALQTRKAEEGIQLNREVIV